MPVQKRSSKNESSSNVYTIPPQGKRKMSIQISFSYAASDKDTEEEISKHILRFVSKK